MMKKAIFPGSFDPVTIGHLDIIKRSAEIFDEVIVAIGINDEKEYYYSLEDRKKMLENACALYQNVKVETFDGMFVDYAKKKNIFVAVRGIRSKEDLEYESLVAKVYKETGNVECVFLMADEKLSGISSTLVRDKLKKGESVVDLIP